jgi:gliding motility-associated-like protein
MSEQSSPSPVTLASPDNPYKLILTLTNKSDKSECSVIQNFHVDYALDLFIPNVFTPNGLEPNNTWKFREIEKWTSMFDIQVQVFSRNGAMVYSAKGYNNSTVVWDGRRNGENVPIGTYYYVVTLVPKSSSKVTPLRPLRGTVTIMR